jgi:hypothetical protein
MGKWEESRWHVGVLFKGPFFFLMVLEFEHRAYTLSHSIRPFFVMGFFKIGSLTAFARAGFEP